MSVGIQIKDLRKIFNLTQSEMATRLQISRNNIATYETGKSNPGESTIALICREFNVNEEWLRTGNGEMFKQLDRKEELTQAIEKFLGNENDTFKERLINILIRLNSSEWKVLEQIAIKIFNDKINNNDEITATDEELSATEEEPVKEIDLDFENIDSASLVTLMSRTNKELQKRESQALRESNDYKNMA